MGYSRVFFFALWLRFKNAALEPFFCSVCKINIRNSCSKLIATLQEYKQFLLPFWESCLIRWFLLTDKYLNQKFQNSRRKLRRGRWVRHKGRGTTITRSMNSRKPKKKIMKTIKDQTIIILIHTLGKLFAEIFIFGIAWSFWSASWFCEKSKEVYLKDCDDMDLASSR